MTTTKKMGRPPGAADAPLPAQNPEFRQWRLRLGLSQLAAAAALGYTEARIAQYDRGQAALDDKALALRLAMEALEQRPVLAALTTWRNDALAVIRRLTDSLSVEALIGDTDLTELGHNIACLEGWDLFEAGNRLEIERDDEANVFADDVEALSFVRRQAKAGSTLHALALKMHHTKLTAIAAE